MKAARGAGPGGPGRSGQPVIPPGMMPGPGVQGLYDYELQYGMGQQAGLTTQQPGGNTPAAPIDDGPTIFDAVRELGLKLSLIHISEPTRH